MLISHRIICHIHYHRTANRKVCVLVYLATQIKLVLELSSLEEFHAFHLAEHLICRYMANNPKLYAISGATSHSGVTISFVSSVLDRDFENESAVRSTIKSCFQNDLDYAQEVEAISLERTFRPEIPFVENLSRITCMKVVLSSKFQFEEARTKINIPLRNTEDLIQYSRHSQFGKFLEHGEYEGKFGIRIEDQVVFSILTPNIQHIANPHHLFAQGISAIGSPLWWACRRKEVISYGFQMYHFVHREDGYLVLLLRGSKVNLETCNVTERRNLYSSILKSFDRQSFDYWDRNHHEGILRLHFLLKRISDNQKLQSLIDKWRIPKWTDDFGAIEYDQMSAWSARAAMDYSKIIAAHLRTRLSS